MILGGGQGTHPLVARPMQWADHGLPSVSSITVEASGGDPVTPAQCGNSLQ